MPRYYFHLRGGRGTRLLDEHGMPLPDAEAAWYQAVRSARELILADRALGYSWAEQKIEVEDWTGTPVHEILLDDVAAFSF